MRMGDLGSEYVEGIRRPKRRECLTLEKEKATRARGLPDVPVRLGLVLDPAGSSEFLRLEALAAEHGASLRWTERYRRFLSAGRAVGRRFHALAADAAA